VAFDYSAAELNLCLGHRYRNRVEPRDWPNDCHTEGHLRRKGNLGRTLRKSAGVNEGLRTNCLRIQRVNGNQVCLVSRHFTRSQVSKKKFMATKLGMDVSANEGPSHASHGTIERKKGENSIPNYQKDKKNQKMIMNKYVSGRDDVSANKGKTHHEVTIGVTKCNNRANSDVTVLMI